MNHVSELRRTLSCLPSFLPLAGVDVMQFLRRPIYLMRREERKAGNWGLSVSVGPSVPLLNRKRVATRRQPG